MMLIAWQLNYQKYGDHLMLSAFPVFSDDVHDLG